ncbi:MAG: hypothetical protein IPJ61_09670 [Tessaracoccus sp.]|uniref:SpvB/TcaC N-terminal domain-containing protein n=1 Tax=Tessaracoccus sp. TaxID=1971211 RepID=UPI001EC411C7|nr:SpvB/TcaC N-terminal domain-containing protein [Tessaracoccus sp.]MBK7821329.1 hypothetical protein [Tessaracoccus sp.]
MDKLDNAGVRAAPSISLPKGGGAIRGIGEKFVAGAVTGTGGFTVPLPVSPGRAGLQPPLALSYDSGSGNGAFGLGWSLGLPAIARKTDKGLPRYDDAASSDVFVLSGAEDLVPAVLLDDEGAVVVDGEGRPVPDEDDRGAYRVVRYRPRTEGLFARIERWVNREDPADTHWRTITRENVTSLYGRDAGSRIVDPADPVRIFTWLLCESYDDLGNGMQYAYTADDDAGVDLGQAHERHRAPAARTTQRYLTSVRYGNVVSRLHQTRGDEWRDDWLFELVFDYGDRRYEDLPLDPARAADAQLRCVEAALDGGDEWAVRPDPFSTYRAGFEIRTYRRCQRVLMFHRLPELGSEPCLVKALELGYADTRGEDAPSCSLLTSATVHGFVRDGQDTRYVRQSMPPVTFRYSAPMRDVQVRTLDADSVANLPVGLGIGYEWVDLDGEGLSGVLTELAGEWWYKRNRGGGAFGPLELVAARPNGGLREGRRLLDLAGDGLLDLVALDGPDPGFFERTDDAAWAPHREFRSLPNVSWADPALRFADLTGDGHADVLVAEADAFSWYPSLGEDGFGPSRLTTPPFDENEGPRLVFADGTESVHLADMSGDGLADLVRIRVGEVSYWPNLGYGRFGTRVVMDDAPLFDRDGQFDPARIRLADIDGSGTTDIVYLAATGARVHLNRSGNGFAEGYLIAGFPPIDDLTSVSTVDLLGVGTSCLVWSSPLSGDERGQLRYIDLMPGGKPNLLVEIHNNLGAETLIRYAPSTRFFLDDEAAGKPWITRLPFPVHVVDRVETVDRVSGNRFVSRYEYHHGYFDGVEREFRGFARVDQYDTAEYDLLPAATNLDATSYLPPVLTRSWYHTGAHLGRDRIARLCADEYYREPGLSPEEVAVRLLDDTVLPAELTTDEEREACRALRGTLLRQETYALDGGSSAAHPYVVAESNAAVRLVQARGDNPHAVFLTHATESVTYQYERAPADPRVTHALTLAVNGFGQPTRVATVSYGRRNPDPALVPGLQGEQTRLTVAVTETAYTNPLVDAAATPDDHRLPVPWAVRGYELTGSAPSGGRFTCTELDDAVAAADELAYEAAPTSGRIEKRLIEADHTRFRADDLSGPCPWGRLEPRALQSESYRLAFTPGLLAGVYRRSAAGAVEDLLPDPAAVLGVDPGAPSAADTAGYVEIDGAWWIPSGRAFYAVDPDASAAEELAEARAHFFLPRRYRNPFHTIGTPTESTVDFDPHDLQPVASADALGNTTRAELDYRTLSPSAVTGPNGERTAVAFDALGMVVATATMGRVAGAPQGDTLGGVEPLLTEAETRAAFADPLAAPSDLLGDATTRLVYDLSAYARTRDADQPAPTGVHTLARETHASNLPAGATSRVQHAFSYSDGFGREIQKKIQAEGGRWVGSEWTEFDNKGNPVRQWEPFFSGTHRCDFDAAIGVTKRLFYDPLSRAVAVLHPNGTYSKTVFDAWRQTSFDPNDTVAAVGAETGDPRTDPDIAGLVAGYVGGLGVGWSTWWQRRQEPGTSAPERDAAAKAAAHAGTPTTTYLDALGRSFLTRAHNGSDAAGDPVLFDTRVVLDIEGNQRAVIDAAGRVVATFDHDVAGNQIHQASMEAGERWTLADAAGNPIRAWDSRGHTLTTEYDALRRPVRHLVAGAGDHSDPDTRAGAVAYQVTEYGEGLPNAEARFLRGRVHRQYDAAGVVSNTYDFKGNVVRQTRAIAPDHRAAIDWAQPQSDGARYVSVTVYDALNRPTQQVAPRRDDAAAPWDVTQPTYNEAGLLEALHVWTGLAGEPTGLIDPLVTAPSGVGVDDIDYDAKGLRTSVSYRGGVVTDYEYDPDTFRLTRLTTRRGGGGGPLQDLRYTYDPVGNVTQIRDGAQREVFFANQVASPNNSYTYDPTYRLIHAEGREHVGQANAAAGYTHDDWRRTRLAHPGDGGAMARYGESYEYDPVGNLQAMAHTSGIAGVAWRRTFAYEEPTQLDDTVGGAPRRSNRLTSSTIAGITATFSVGGDGYDPHGNLLRMPHLAEMAWDFRDRLRLTARQVVDADDVDGAARDGDRTYYVYDAGGTRVRKVTEVGGVVKEERLYLGGVEIYRRHTGQHAGLERRTLHVMDDERRIALVDLRNNVDDGAPSMLARYQLGNHLGSTTLEVDDQANLVSYEEYSPYGSTTYQAVRADIQVPAKRYRYTGKERDEESGLSYHGARYYAPWLARWTSCDPAGIADGPNRYIYCRGHPTTARDPGGAATTPTPLLNSVDDVLSFEAREAAFAAGKKLELGFDPTTKEAVAAVNGGKALPPPTGKQLEALVESGKEAAELRRAYAAAQGGLAGDELRENLRTRSQAAFDTSKDVAHFGDTSGRLVPELTLDDGTITKVDSAPGGQLKDVRTADVGVAKQPVAPANWESELVGKEAREVLDETRDLKVSNSYVGDKAGFLKESGGVAVTEVRPWTKLKQKVSAAADAVKSSKALAATGELVEKVAKSKGFKASVVVVGVLGHGVAKAAPFVGLAVGASDVASEVEQGNGRRAALSAIGMSEIPFVSQTADIGLAVEDASWAAKDILDPDQKLEDWYYRTFLK